MKNKLSEKNDAIIFTALKDQSIVLNIWNKTSSEVSGLNVKTDLKEFNTDSIMAVGNGNDNPDTVHQIDLKSGENIYAWCAKEDAVEYEIVTL